MVKSDVVNVTPVPLILCEAGLVLQGAHEVGVVQFGAFWRGRAAHIVPLEGHCLFDLNSVARSKIVDAVLSKLFLADCLIPGQGVLKSRVCQDPVPWPSGTAPCSTTVFV